MMPCLGSVKCTSIFSEISSDAFLLTFTSILYLLIVKYSCAVTLPIIKIEKMMIEKSFFI
jgi:hypothetical protein